MDVVSLFSGCGGLDLGFVHAGANIVWANDIWEDAAKTYRLNLGDHIVTDDIASLDLGDIPDADIVVGGFPCQGFSVANMTRHTGDWRNQLYRHFLEVLDTKRPPFFLAENVKGILSLGKGAVFDQILSDFSDVGYDVQHAVLNAADFGVPQRRERVFIFGKMRGLEDQPEFPPQKTHSNRRDDLYEQQLSPWVGVGEALRNIPHPDEPHELENHEASKYKLRFNGYLGHREIDPAKPCPTITARGDDRGGVVIHHHPSNTRRLTAREAAIVQSFPLDYKFFGTKTSVYRQVANAVPPLLARRIAEGIRVAACV